MKFLIFSILLLGIGSWTYGQIRNDQPIEKGIYFILNGNRAIQPLGPTLANSVFLEKFRHKLVHQKQNPQRGCDEKLF